MIEDTNPNVKLKTDTEMLASLLIRQALSAGIPVENIAISREKVRALLDEGWMAENAFDAALMLDDLYSVRSDWARQRSVILIDGGDSISRTWVGHALLFRSITNLSSDGIFGALTSRCDPLVSRFSQFGEERSILLDNLQRAPSLLITEIQEHLNPNTNNFGNIYFDEMLQGRQEGNRPTILTFSDQKIETRNYGGNSRLLDEIIKNQHSPLRRTYHFRLITNG